MRAVSDCFDWLKSCKPNRKWSKSQNDNFLKLHRLTEGNLTLWTIFSSGPRKLTRSDHAEPREPETNFLVEGMSSTSGHPGS